MPQKRKSKANAKRLGKSLRAHKGRARTRRARKDSVREKPRGHTGRAVANERDIPPFFRLVGGLSAEKIRFQLIGMSAAVLQGVPVVTHDVDLWVDLPARQYIRPVNVALRHGATV